MSDDLEPTKGIDDEISSGLEKYFKRRHTVKIQKHPVAGKNQFKGKEDEDEHNEEVKLKTYAEFRTMSPQNEATELFIEQIKPGNLTLDSGEKVTVTSDEAKILNDALKELKASTRSEMEREMMSDSKSFGNVLSFLHTLRND